MDRMRSMGLRAPSPYELKEFAVWYTILIAIVSLLLAGEALAAFVTGAATDAAPAMEVLEKCLLLALLLDVPLIAACLARAE